MGGEVVTREYATGSHPPDPRYSDMAPKWVSLVKKYYLISVLVCI